MRIKQEIPKHIQDIVNQLNEQISHHEIAIETLRLQVKMWLKYQPAPQKLFPSNSPLTRELVRNYLSSYGQPMQTVQFIDLLYKNISEEERNKLIKTLSVIFNQMAKEGEIIIEKRKGVKGNFYSWKK